MNKKDALKLKPGRWIEIHMRGVQVALVVARTTDLGAGLPAQISLLCEGVFTKIGHQDVLQDTGLDLVVPDGPTAIAKARTLASLRSSVAIGLRKAKRVTDKPDLGDEEECVALDKTRAVTTCV